MPATPARSTAPTPAAAPQLLTRVLENETGIRIDQYVEIGLGGVADVVDAVGGIEVCPRERLKDPLAGLDIKKGCQEVDGATALAYSRSRKQSTLGDLERVRRQREVIGADRRQGALALVGGQPGALVAASTTRCRRSSASATGMSVDRRQPLGAGDDGHRQAAATCTCTMPVTDLSATTWDRDRADPLFQAIIDDQTDDITDAAVHPQRDRALR